MILNINHIIIFSKNTQYKSLCTLQEKMTLVPWPGHYFMFDYDKRELLIDIPPRRGLKNGDYSFMVETYEIFHTFFARHNVDLDILHEEADGPWLPGGELQNDWVCPSHTCIMQKQVWQICTFLLFWIFHNTTLGPLL